VTVANTREHQEALAAVHTHSKKFFVTGGKHVTSDDMFISGVESAESGGRGEGEG
jgi:hypothetical protein